jgi:putative ABC transport system permease protein
MMSRFLWVLAMFMGGIFAFGAAAGAMITLHAAVSCRTREIGTLRALGFTSTSILLSIVTEAALIGLLGGVIGLAAAGFLEGFSLTTLNVQTYAGISFEMLLTWGIQIQALSLAVLLGIAGGLFPAWRATRLGICDALREAG